MRRPLRRARPAPAFGVAVIRERPDGGRSPSCDSAVDNHHWEGDRVDRLKGTRRACSGHSAGGARRERSRHDARRGELTELAVEREQDHGVRAHDLRGLVVRVAEVGGKHVAEPRAGRQPARSLLDCSKCSKHQSREGGRELRADHDPLLTSAMLRDLTPSAHRSRSKNLTGFRHVTGRTVHCVNGPQRRYIRAWGEGIPGLPKCPTGR